MKIVELTVKENDRKNHEEAFQLMRAYLWNESAAAAVTEMQNVNVFCVRFALSSTHSYMY